MGDFAWAMQRGWFGGFSGIELSRDGRDMLAMTDRARIVKAGIRREDGRITGITPGRSWALHRQNGKVLIGHTVDSEGLAQAAGGDLFISFERIHRVSHYPSPGGPSRGLQRPPMLRDLPFNGGIEALAITPDHDLIAVPEDHRDSSGDIPLFLWRDGQWSNPFGLPTDGQFLPVGADFGPHGRFYLLERGFNLFGFRTRVRSWHLTDTGAQGERCELQTSTGTHDNLEGLALWRDDMGRVRLTMIADDNFFFLQRTELVEYALTGGVAYSAATR
ncbi:esterase-like activity of phytase family protein [Rhodobacteraceae bacterium F11138]|nr:esterase-like activity of phytase family protein [Rhodobacteraceae bacterium F11138]